MSLNIPMSFFTISLHCDIDMPLIVLSTMAGWIAGVSMVVEAGCGVVD